MFSSGLDPLALGAAALLAALYWWLQRSRVLAWWIYVPPAAATWVAVHGAGIHTTDAGCCSACSPAVPTRGRTLRAVFAEPVPLAVLSALLLGKVAGNVGASWLAARITPACRPRGLGRRDLTAVSMLGGVGLTVSLLIAQLALTGPLLDVTKAAVLIASAVASLLGAALLLRRCRVHVARARAG